MKLTHYCPICKEPPFFTIRKIIYFEKYPAVNKEVAREYFRMSNDAHPEEIVSLCLNCKTIYRAKFFDAKEIEEIYNNLYHSLEENAFQDRGFVYNNEEFLNGCSKKTYALVLGLEKTYNIKIADIFDIGGRDGFRLKELAKKGYNCKVFDPIACRPCQEMIKKEYLTSFQIKKDDKADFILLCNVLEHSIDPYEMIKNCYEHLRDGGFLYVELPSDIESVLDWIFCTMILKRNLMIDNTHYIFYSFKAITLLLESCGFTCVRRKMFILPAVKANVLGIIGRKEKPKKSSISFLLSLDFDLLRSGYFVRFPFRVIKKISSAIFHKYKDG